jgi:hypothetical protein
MARTYAPAQPVATPIVLAQALLIADSRAQAQPNIVRPVCGGARSRADLVQA